MSKLFKLKEWLTISKAAEYLSVVFGEEVTEADVFRLALDNKLTLSIYFTKFVELKRAEIAPIPSEFKHYITYGSSMVVTQADEIIYLNGIFDLPLLDSERLLIEEKYNYSINSKNNETFKCGSVLLKQNNQLFELQSQFDQIKLTGFDEIESKEQFQKKYAVDQFVPAISFPEHGLLIVRADALRELEEFMSSSDNSNTKSFKESTLKIENLLRTLTAIAIEEYGYNPNDKKSPIPKEISEVLNRQGKNCDPKTIRGWLKEGATLLEINLYND